MDLLVCFMIIVSYHMGLVESQGTKGDEAPLPLIIRQCTTSGCEVLESTSVTIDASWRNNNGVLEGFTVERYTNNGVTVKGDAITLRYVAPHGGIGSRLYVLQDKEYIMFKLKNREFVVDIDVSEIECAINAVSEGAMDETLGKWLLMDRRRRIS